PSLSTHLDRSLPSKRTAASEGARPGLSCVLAVPGSTIGGSGRFRSWIFHFIGAWAAESWTSEIRMTAVSDGKVRVMSGASRAGEHDTETWPRINTDSHGSNSECRLIRVNPCDPWRS